MAVDFISERISEQLGLYVAERHVLWHKEKLSLQAHGTPPCSRRRPELSLREERSSLAL